MGELQRVLIVVLWLAWLVYWIASARGAKKIARIESRASQTAQSIPLIVGGLLIEVPALGGMFDTGFLPRSFSVDGWYWVCVAIVSAGLGFTVWARRHLGTNWSLSVTLKQDHELVRGGPYRLVRHPIYSGALLAVLGAALASGQWRGLLGTALVAASLIYKIRLEERWLEERFGDAYRRYCKEVSALVPGLY